MLRKRPRFIGLDSLRSRPSSGGRPPQRAASHVRRELRRGPVPGAATPVRGRSLATSVRRASGFRSMTAPGAHRPAFLGHFVSASAATVTDSQGNTVGYGAVALQTSARPVAISGTVSYRVSGQGSLSFYGPAESSLGVSGDWTSYTATVTGTVSITLTTSALTLEWTNSSRRNVHDHDQLRHADRQRRQLVAQLRGVGSRQCHRRHDRPRAGDGQPFRRRRRRSVPVPRPRWTAIAAPSRSRPAGNGTDAVNLNGTASNVLQVTVSHGPVHHRPEYAHHLPADVRDEPRRHL